MGQYPNGNNREFHKQESVEIWTVSSVPVTSANQSVETVTRQIIENKQLWDEINSIFILDDERRPIGYASIEALINSSSSLTMGQIMAPVKSVTLADDQEQAVILSISQQLESVPVTDSEGRFAGAVPSKNVLTILHLENIEDSLKIAGIQVEGKVTDITGVKALQLAKYRLPWLLLGLIGGLMATLIVGFFEGMLSRQIALAFFIPLIVYMSGAIGVQTQTLYIRGIAAKPIEMRFYLTRELLVGLIIGMPCGFLTFLFTYLWLDSLTIAFITGASMFAGMSSAVLIGIFIPWFFAYTKKDPAFGTGPFATVLQDILSISIYFLVAYLVFAKLG